MSFAQQQPSSIFELDFPQSVGIYPTYADAQKAVDFLADEKFEVQNLAIVGTDLKSVERVLGRRTWGSVIGQGVQSGLSTGLFVAIILLLFVRPSNISIGVMLISVLVIAIALSIGFASAGYAMSRGRRDFTSVTQTVATKYEVLCEHKLAAQAREMLQQLPGARAAAFE